MKMSISCCPAVESGIYLSMQSLFYLKPYTTWQVDLLCSYLWQRDYHSRNSQEIESQFLSPSLYLTHTQLEVAQCNLLPSTEQLHWSRCRFSAAFKGISAAVMDGWVTLVQFIYSDTPPSIVILRIQTGDFNHFYFMAHFEFRAREHNKSASWCEDLKLVGSKCLVSDSVLCSLEEPGKMIQRKGDLLGFHSKRIQRFFFSPTTAVCCLCCKVALCIQICDPWNTWVHMVAAE